MIKICKFCGQRFETPHNRQIYCSALCCDRQQKKRYHLRNKDNPPPGKTLEDWMREARDCGLDYGTYRALIERGKTFDELKADADNRHTATHSHVGHLSSSRHGWRLS